MSKTLAPGLIVLVSLVASSPAQEAPAAGEEETRTASLKLVRADPRSYEATCFRIELATDDPKDFRTVQPGKGVVNAKAIVASFRATDGKTILAAYDAGKPDQLHPDVLRIDLSGEGDFTQALVVPRLNMFDLMGTPGYAFLKEDLTVETAQAKVPMGVYSQLTRGQSPAALLSLAWFARGAVELGGRRHAFRLVDADYNFRLGDPAKAVVEYGRPAIRFGDSIQIDFVRDTFQQHATLFLGKPFGLYGKLYEATVSPDIKTISFAPYKGPTAVIRIDHPRWTGHLLGDRAVISLLGDRQPMPVPPGKYRLRTFIQYSEDGYEDRRHALHVADAGIRGKLGQTRDSGDLLLDLKPGQSQDVRIGSPITATIIARRGSNRLFFWLFLQDASEREIYRVSIWGYGGEVGPPELSVEILDARGNSIDKIAVGELGSPWTPPAGLKGQFTAKLRYRNDAFGAMKIVQPQPFELATGADGTITRFNWAPAETPDNPPRGAEPAPTPPTAPAPPDGPLRKEGVATAPAAPTDERPAPAAKSPAASWLAVAGNLLSAGMKDKAGEYLERILAEYPDSPEAKEARRMLGR